MKIRVCAPSYKRADSISTHSYLPYVYYYVSEDEYEDYTTQNPDANIVKAPREQQGNVSRIRNYILDTEFQNGADVVLLVDDDLSTIGRYGVEKRIDADTLLVLVEKYSILCDDFGFKLWGVNVNPDPQNYREYTPFSTTSFVGGPFQCFLKENELRYDESLPLKEDYDMTIQNCNKYRGCLRVNSIYYTAKQGVQVGGVADMRSHDKEAQQYYALLNKWGSKIVRRDTNDRSHGTRKKKVKADYNPIIKIPIKGV